MRLANTLGNRNRRMPAGPTFLAALVVAAGPLLLGVPSHTLADQITDYVIFGNGNVSLGATDVLSGKVGSNADVSIGNGGTLQNVTGGGNFTGGNIDVTGNIGFNGNVTVGNNGQVAGNIVSGGNVVIGGNADVVGSVTATGTITLGALATAGSQNAGAGSQTPFSPVTIPTGSVFAAGGANVAKANNQPAFALAAGSYGSLNLGGGNVLNLSGGDYYFSSITIGNNTDLRINAPTGIRIFVSGDVSLGSIDFILDGGTTASDIYIETSQDWSSGNNSQVFGTIFAPGGDITFGSTDLTGAAYSGGIISFGNNSEVTFDLASNLPGQYSVTSVSAVPEPEIYAMLAAGLGLMGFFARRRRQAAGA